MKAGLLTSLPVVVGGSAACAAFYAAAYGARLVGTDIIHGRGDWGPEWAEEERDHR